MLDFTAVKPVEINNSTFAFACQNKILIYESVFINKARYRLTWQDASQRVCILD